MHQLMRQSETALIPLSPEDRTIEMNRRLSRRERNSGCLLLTWLIDNAGYVSGKVTFREYLPFRSLQRLHSG